ncbi:MAG: hypothetical protein V4568_04465 [Pseudomonadota bacterium]
MNYKKLVLLSTMSCILAPLTAQAEIKTETFTCNVVHYVRKNVAELRSTSILIRNADLVNAVTINRLTIRNVFGTVVHDSGPAAGVPIPLNTDFSPDLDISVVPPGASYYLRTNNIWGNNSLPVSAGNNQAGQFMSATVQVSKNGKKNLVSVSTRPRARERIVTATGAIEGIEHSSDSVTCTRIDD